FMQNDSKVWTKLGDNLPGTATEDLQTQASNGSLYGGTFARSTWRLPIVAGTPPYGDANIQITANGTHRVGGTHTFTAHVNTDDGAGFTSAPDGTQISFSIDSGPGSFTTPNPCTTTGGTGSCTITLTSPSTGATKGSAHVDVTPGGVAVHRDTDGAGGNSGPATATWVDARIAIASSA